VFLALNFLPFVVGDHWSAAAVLTWTWQFGTMVNRFSKQISVAHS
jgi:hypothetical protein